ncbi:hypothetical protein [Pyxidicoccus xibeiensis]|uniref:hypothetical protein n=1 Tax=Pyxidicoccus xibeiensis TaxID=2906759 RepID=UPI0020A80F99|nr:hypothetical protein [Pyxidicoccus xibeiensis]MCP3142762.1 hypothetical protein [Pyxidicoccus xibeiensis]
MLTIRTSQMQAFVTQRERVFAQWALPHLLRRAPGALAALPGPEQERRVMLAIRRARTWGLWTGEGLLEFVSLMFEVAPRFDEHPVVQALLHDAEQPPDASVHLLRFRLEPGAVAELRQRYEDAHWE